MYKISPNSDDLLRTAVLDQIRKVLSEAPDLNPIQVTVHNGYAILDGVVHCQATREAIGRRLRNLDGVIGICNRMRLDNDLVRCPPIQKGTRPLGNGRAGFTNQTEREGANNSSKSALA